MKTYADLLGETITGGIEGARRDYKPGDKLDGSIAGFEACRNKSPGQLATLLEEARLDTRSARLADDPPGGEGTRYWYWRCRELEIEWVCNVVSAALMNEGKPVIVPPTLRGAARAAESSVCTTRASCDRAEGDRPRDPR